MGSSRSLITAACLCLFLASCRGDEPQRLLRLGELITLTEIDPQRLEVEGTVTEEHSIFPVAIDAARYTRLEIQARGDASMLELGWKLGREKELSHFRRLSFPTLADGEIHTYEVELQREPYWVGSVNALTLSTREGSTEILEVKAAPATSAYRDLALGGESVPSLPALDRYELVLPENLPRPLVFEARLGIVPSYDREGARVRFRAYCDEGRQRDEWLDEVVEGVSGKTSSGWKKVRLPVSACPGAHVVLEATATQNGEPLPEGVAAWGDPILLAGLRGAEPDLVVVVIDTLRADVLGAYGNDEGLTPNLDALAAETLRFEDLTSPAPWTLPSVTSLITGLQPQTHGAGQRHGNFAPTGLSDAAHTLAEALAGAGFFTAGIYHNIYLNPPFGLDQGYDSYLSAEVEDDQLVDLAIKALEDHRDRRLFLYLHLFGPHNPYEPPQDVCDEVARRLVPKYHGGIGCSGDRRPQGPMPRFPDRPWLEALYKAEVANTDRQLGRFLEALDKDRPGALLLVVSDHGEDFWDRQVQLREHGYRVNADHGQHHFHELLHVPAMLRLPGRAPTVVGAPIEMVDFYPTLLAALGIEAPSNQGRNLLPLLDGAPPERLTRISDYLLYGQPRWAVQRGPWKLVVPEPAETDLLPELYNLEDDPQESIDLAAQRPEVVAALRQFASHEIERRRHERSRYLSGRDLLSATFLEWNHITKLRSLGYLQ